MPSRRSSAPRSPGCWQASDALRMRSLSAAVKRRRIGFWITWGSGAESLLWSGVDAESGWALEWPLLETLSISNVFMRSCLLRPEDIHSFAYGIFCHSIGAHMDD